MKHLSELICVFIGFYILIAFCVWIAFSAIEPPRIDKHGPSADAFLKAIVWPYSVIEYNKEH